ncbi:MAG TPA: AI-2E family transporter [Puia sp.]|nr:AI-2E family transporter [Puia sp.]
MMNTNHDASFKFPFYAKLILLFIGGVFLVYGMYQAQQIIVPFLYATIIAVLLNPIVNFLVRKKMKRIIAITIAVVAAILFTLAVIYLISSQLKMFKSTVPQLETKFTQLINDGAQWVSDKFDISPKKMNEWLLKTKSSLLANGNAVIGQTLLTITGVLVVVFLIPVYIFMILYYKPLLLQFVRMLFNNEHREKVEEVLYQTKTIIQSYLNGLLIEAFIIASLNSIALLILGIDYAILLGIIGALLNVIPFIGGIISVALPIIIALATKNSATYPILVLVLYMLIQFFDNHYITPKIVASKVKVNALMAVIVVLIGNEIWGIPGMFLAIPLTGILKVIFEHIEQLTAWAFLLGDTMPITGKYLINFPKKRVRKIKEQN